MGRHRMGRGLAAWLLSAVVLGVLALAACGTSSTVARVPTAAEVLQNASSVLNVNGAPGNSSGAVKDLTYNLKFGADIKFSSSTLGSQELTETMTGSGKETLSPRRDESSITLSMALAGTSYTLTMSDIVDYSTKTGYVKLSGITGLPGASANISANKWYKLSFATLGGFGADTSLYTDYSKLTNAKLIGGQTLNGVPVWHLRANEDLFQALGAFGGSSGTSGSSGPGSGSGLKMTATLDYYFRQDNYRPVKITLAFAENDQRVGMTMTITGEMDFTSFNTGIVIELPAAKSTLPLNI